ncbi:MAG: bifunctional diguanylate cyclase/phosphodiesterase [Lachnospiraceae bacterium]|nr:bifunctional diguanylate cyclase/phosphodiesterase [Lachnospiraceae bacterium]
MTDKKYKHSIQNRIILSILTILFFQAVLIVGILFGIQTSRKLDQSCVESLQNSVTNRGSTLEQKLASWTDIGDYEESIQELVAQIATENHMEIGEAMADPELCDEVARKSFDRVLEALRRSGATECFLILEGDSTSSKKPAVILRDLNPDESGKSNDDILVEAGKSEELTELGLTMDSFWAEKYELPGNALFYDKPYSAGNSHGAIEAVDLGYFSDGFSLRERDIEMISYSIPLLDENHRSYGVIGYGISLDYLRKQMPSKEIGVDNNATYYLGITENSVDYKTVVTEQKTYSALLPTDSEVAIRENRYDGIYNVTIYGDTTHCAAIYPMRTYNTNTPFEHEKWVLFGIANNDVLQRASRQFKQGMAIALFASLIVSIVLAIGLVYVLNKKIQILMKGVKNISPSQMKLPQTGIKEFDELADEIIDQSKTIYRYGNRMSDIIHTAGVPLAVMQYHFDSEKAYCTERFMEIFEITLPQWKDNYIRKDLLLPVLTEIRSKLVSVEDEKYVYYYCNEEGRDRYILMKPSGPPQQQMYVFLDVTKDMREKERIKHDRDFDILTNLYNRRALARKAIRLIETENCRDGILSVWDLDNLKYVNDTYGHDVGDRYLCLLADIFREHHYENSIVARLSGDEFIIILHGDYIQNLVQRIKDIHTEFMNREIMLPDGSRLHASASVGVAVFGADGTTYAELFRHADFALLEVKRSAKGYVRVFDKNTYEKDQILVNSVMELDRVILEEDVRYAFQPIVDLHTNQVYAYEALMRPQSDTLRSPADLLRAAEVRSKLDRIERITWFRSIECFMAQRDKCPDAKLFINSLPNQCMSREDFALINRMYGDSLEWIVMETTENAEISSESEQIKAEWCSQHQVSTALDDFGSGYSNTNTLMARCYGFIKLDMTLIRNIHESQSQQTLVAGIIGYCHENNIKVIAEGIETQEEVDTVVRLGADYGQGYFLGKPQMEVNTN